MSTSEHHNTDDLGLVVTIPDRVRRVVSIVPSLTESVAQSVGAGQELLVGATAWCSHPTDLDVVRIGGTKNPDIAAIIELEPDLVLANEEENRLSDLDALRAAGLALWVTNPTTVPQALRSLDRMLAACGLDRPGWLDQAEQAWAAEWSGPRRTAVVPIWRRPWMAVGRDTFAGDVLARLGVDNALAADPERYPKIRIAELPAHELVVLPDEPYAFTPEDGPEAFEAPAVCVSGRHLTWYGPSLAEAREVLLAQLTPAQL